LTLITNTTPTGVGSIFYKPYAVGASPNMDRIFFQAAASLVPGTPGSEVAPGNLYEWHKGTIHPVGVLPGGSLSRGSAAGSEMWPFGATTNSRAISSDATKVYFEVPMGPDPYSIESEGQLYVRINSETTVHVSKAMPGVVDANGPKPAKFESASANGSVAYFTSKEELTNDANTGPEASGNELYRFDLDTKELTAITAIDDALNPNGAVVREVLDISDDGSYVYFAARGQLAPGAPDNGLDSVYVWHDGEIKFISPGAPGSTPGFATPDGRHFAFRSSGPSPTGYDNTNPVGFYPFEVIYVFDFGTGKVACASCTRTGERPTGNATFGYDANTKGGSTPNYERGNISNDGRRVFFTSPDPLTATAGKGFKKVYMYEGGKVHLLSPPGLDSDVGLADASQSGDDVLIVTSAQLSPLDGDHSFDMYDARVGGGFPLPGVAAPCSGEGCREGAGVPPPPASAGSAQFSGPGNAKPKHAKPCAKKKRGKKGRCAKGKGRAGKRGKAGNRGSKRAVNAQNGRNG
jgi:hypothetical protein